MAMSGILCVMLALSGVIETSSSSVATGRVDAAGSTVIESHAEGTKSLMRAANKHENLAVEVSSMGSIEVTEPTYGTDDARRWGAKKKCTLSGDPHIMPFDGGKMFHPMHAPGHWWLVRTQNNAASIQAVYGGCGDKDKGGWQSTKLNGVPRTCIMGVGIGGEFIKGNKLSIEPPCSWDYEKSNCRNTDKDARAQWNGKTVKLPFTSEDPPVTVKQSKKNLIEVKLPHEVHIHLWLGGAFKGNPYSMFNVHIEAPPISPQCGHCGNFNGKSDDDMIYQQTGVLKADSYADKLCDPAVPCDQRLIPEREFGSYAADAANTKKCEPNPEGVGFTIDDCPKMVRTNAELACKKDFEGKEFKDEQTRLDGLNDCILDECMAAGMGQADADDAQETEQEEQEGFDKAAGDHE